MEEQVHGSTRQRAQRVLTTAVKYNVLLGVSKQNTGFFKISTHIEFKGNNLTVPDRVLHAVVSAYFLDADF